MGHELNNLLARALHYRKQGQISAAEELYLRCLDFEPHFAPALHDYAGLLIEQHRFEEAIRAEERSIAIQAYDVNQYIRLGFALWKSGQLDRALAVTQKAASLQPPAMATFLNLAGILCELSFCDQAILALQQAVALDPNRSEIHLYLGNLLKQTNRLDQAELAYQQALALQPALPAALESLAQIFTEKANYRSALHCLRQFVRLRPDDDNGRFNLGMMVLRHGMFEEGWQLYESRFTGDWACNGLVDSPDLYRRKPRFSMGCGGRVLVLAEQGIGDQIMFASMLSDLALEAEMVMVQCDDRLHPLLRRSLPPDIQYLDLDSDLGIDCYDFEIPMGSLGCLYRQQPSCFENAAFGYLQPDPKQVAYFQQRLAVLASGLKVGISWQSGLKRSANQVKSIGLQDLFDGLARPGLTLVNLQYGDVDQEWAEARVPQGCQKVSMEGLHIRDDLDGLAALMGACDLVVTIDNVTAHLAGALARPVLLLLPFCGDWRWGTDADRSYWYRSLCLLRQSAPGDWSSPLRGLWDDSSLLAKRDTLRIS
jgi:tetratricopeptide (TPR) repeat protein